MRRAFSVITSLLLIAGAANKTRAESTWEFSVQVSAQVQTNPAQIILSWPQDTVTVPASYTIFRKTPGAGTWGTGITLAGTTTTYTDNNVTVGIAYEYKVVKVTTQYTGYGYLYAGINVPLTEDRGKLLLVVDNTYAASLANELTQLQQDLMGDGWTVIRNDVSRNTSAVNVKNLIKAQYKADPANVKAVFLFGHVPVAYSGDIVPDGHTPDHQGAWPCDGFYGDMDGVWTDNTVNDNSAADARTRNVPGDGKFDQSTFPAPIKLMVGRVDLANLPGRLSWDGAATFPSELELLRNYLNKDHKFRTKQFDLPRRAFVGDYFGVRDGEAFAASGWRNFASFFGASSSTDLPNKGTWIPTLSANPCLWAYGCGAGSFTSIGGLGNSNGYNDGTTTEFVQNDAKAAFFLLFGSWLGDWDSEDDILRSVLALPSYGLAAAWSGRPHWFLQHMALGETIGFGARLTQNNNASGIYQNQVNSCAGQIHIALMGDPTLRMHVVAPPANVLATADTAGVSLSWTASSEAVSGYHVYSASGPNGSFTRLTTVPTSGTAYRDSTTNASAYMVRAVKLETSGSGTYYNLSQGAFLNGASVITGGEVAASSTNIPLAMSSTNSSNAAITNSLSPTGNSLTWVDDALPAGAVPGTDSGDSWNWVNSNPTPFAGQLAQESRLSSGLHQNFFYGASSTLEVNPGDVLFAYVYLQPTAMPSAVMLQWNDGSWEHRAYWGANKINSYGNNGTSSRRYMGPLPPAGQWVRLEVPASEVGLEGRTLNGMAFTLFDGQAVWDNAGKSSLLATNQPAFNTNEPPTTTPVPPDAVAWVDDALPAGGLPGTDGGDLWNWVSSNPSPVSGSLANQSSLIPGLHQHFFTSATSTLAVNTGDVLFAYVNLDPKNVPSEVMLQWNDGSWEHRAYWGANSIDYGSPGTTSRRYMGPLPPAGQWVRLTVPASQVALEGATVSGMAFSLYDGRATWDKAGKSTITITNTTPTPSTTPTNTTSVITASNSVIWVDDSLPVQATPGAEYGDSWNWVSSNPSPFSGRLANQSSSAPGLHQHFFYGAGQTLTINSGDVLFAYVYMEPGNSPSALMLQWNDGSWEHRAYWGANKINNYGVDGTASRRYMGPVPQAGRWVRLEVPARDVALEGSILNGMAFTLYDGQATWDSAGKASASLENSVVPDINAPPVVATNSPPPADTSTNSQQPDPGPQPVINTNNPPDSHAGASFGTNALPNANPVDYTTLALPPTHSNTLHVLTPRLLELKLINTKQPGAAGVSEWDLVDSNGQFKAPSASQLTVIAGDQPIAISTVGFKRRPIYAPLAGYDLRIENSLYLELANPLSDNQTIEVKNPDGKLWTSDLQFISRVDPLRFSPAIHVNQEGYMPNFSKKAMVGYYAGTLGEVTVPYSAGFKLVDALTGAQVYQGTLAQRPDQGYTYSSTPYQKVYEADLTSFNTPGEYRLIVPGMGGSLPFLIDAGIGMSFARAYALGLYHQRCGTNTAMPCTRFTHDVCHSAPASVPLPASSFSFSWQTIAGYANTLNANNPPQSAPALTGPSGQLFPFVQQGTLDTTGGHHDAGDYSKYTINSASLVHYLMFAADSLAGVAALDNLGIPESGDGISDVMQEAKWEADYLAKMQDTDGGFYFLIYPRNREYEGDVSPEHGDPQVVWPKTTSVTAASVAALAQCASSPLFKQTYPAAAALYLQKAQLGWQFLTNAIAKYGKNGAYQKITHYGDNFADNDEMVWAACEIYLATGDKAAHQYLLSWFDPADSATWRWGWWHMSECYGHAIRSYAFAAPSGRVASASQLDAAFLSKCRAQIATAGNDAMNWSQQSAYGTSFPSATKAVRGGGWYFSCDQAFDICAAQQLNPKAAYIDALLANMNYEGGCNPVNVSYITGLGWKRQRDIVSQWALNDTRSLPPSGIPVGNLTSSFFYLGLYGGTLEALCFPSDTADKDPYPFYDRWCDGWNVSAEMVVLNQARGLASLAFLAAQTPAKTQPWKSTGGQIVAPTTVAPVGSPVTLSMLAPGLDMSGARVTWEARDQEPAYGPTFTISPKNNGPQWVEAEAQWPDGRRVFAITNFTANSPNIAWVDDALPAGATPSGEDSWNWVSNNPAPFSGLLAHQSSLAAGSHQQVFDHAKATLAIGAGDVLYAYVYLDPSNPPSEVMLQWNDGSWDHRAYWGANNLGYGLDGTPSRFYMGPLPAPGQWVQLKVPAGRVNLEGSTVKGMAFTLFNGRATWDRAGKLSSIVVALDAVTPLIPSGDSDDLFPTVPVLIKNGVLNTLF